jgi:hypothetical protein
MVGERVPLDPLDHDPLEAGVLQEGRISPP